MEKAYSLINWQDLPSEMTPINAENLNKMDKGIDVLDDRVVALNKETIKGVSYDKQTGIVSIETKDGKLTQLDFSVIDPKRIPDMYYKEGDGVILPETTFTVDSSIDDDEMKGIEPALNLVVGEEYIVKWNGVEYKCTVSSFEMEGVTGIYIGEAMGENTGKFPFSFVNAPDMLGDSTLLLIIEGSTITVSVTQGGSTIHTIPEEYLGLDWLPKETINETVLFEEQTVVVDEMESTFGDYKSYNLGLDQETRTKMTNEYETLLVSVDGVEKQLKVARLEENGKVYVAQFSSVPGEINVGDIGVGSGASVLATILLPVGTHTIKVSHTESHFNKMPVEYLPDGVPYMTEAVELFPLTELTSPDNDGAFLFPSEINLVVGEKYTVNWNGLGYETECVEIEEGGNTAKCLGDIGLMTGGTSTGEPFIFVYAPDMYADMGCTGMANALDGSSSVSMSISKGSQIRKLPEECLPESVDSVIIRSSTEGSTKKFKLTVDDSGTISATEIVE